MNAPVLVALPDEPSELIIALEHDSSPMITSTSVINSVDDFSASPGQLALDSFHDSRSDSSHDVLPSYTDCPLPPSYSKRDEQPTLAEYLFKFGFIFFPFWILGACILFVPLREPPPSSTSLVWLPDKSDVERQQIINKIRTVELRWANRCLYACIAVLTIFPLAALLLWQFIVATSAA